MADKDQFTFDDDDDFPETDLSSAFAEGEHSAEDPVQDMPGKQVEAGGNSRTRILLLILLFVVAGGGGAYYFMDLGSTVPSMPAVPVPAQTTSKSVALPPQPVQSTEVQDRVEPAAMPVTVVVPAQPSAVLEPPAQLVEPQQPQPTETVAADLPKPEPVQPPAAEAIVSAADPATTPQSQAPVEPAKPRPAPASQAAAVAPDPAAAEIMKATRPEALVQSPAGGGYALDAGAYLLESNRDDLVAKIRKLGYEPLVTPIDATLDMTRLRLGTFGKDEVQEALVFARSIEPGSYSTPAGDRYVIYAGTFLKSGSVDTLTRRFLDEGIKVYPEPVQVVKTLNRIRFGQFATAEDAATAARDVDQAGVKATVVKN